jgi:hypothetical protein
VNAWQVVVLVARAALYAVYAMSTRTAPHVHYVPVHIVALPRIISGGVAIHAARIPQYRHDRLECRGRGGIIATGLGFYGQ